MSHRPYQHPNKITELYFALQNIKDGLHNYWPLHKEEDDESHKPIDEAGRLIYEAMGELRKERKRIEIELRMCDCGQCESLAHVYRRFRDCSKCGYDKYVYVDTAEFRNHYDHTYRFHHEVGYWGTFRGGKINLLTRCLKCGNEEFEDNRIRNEERYRLCNKEYEKITEKKLEDRKADDFWKHQEKFNIGVIGNITNPKEKEYEKR